MWYGKQASPASSTSTIDQQEIVFDDDLQIQPQQQHIGGQPILYGQQQQQRMLDTSPTNLVVATPSSSNHHQPVQPKNFNTNTTTPNLISNNTHPTVTPITTKRAQNYASVRGNKRAKTPTAAAAAANHTYGAPKANGTNSSSGQTRANLNLSTLPGNNKCSPPKKPKLYTLPQQLAPWKSLQHHFLRHADVKYRPEKRMTMAELGNEVLQRRNGWKVHHLVGQLTDLIQNEMQNREKISSLLDMFVEEGAKQIVDLAHNLHKLPEHYSTLLLSQRSYGKNEFKPELIITKLDDLLRGDLQRSNMFDDHLRDCRDLIVRITEEHRNRVARITTKFNKRIQL